MDLPVAHKERWDGGDVAESGWRLRLCTTLLRWWAWYLGDGGSPRIQNLDLTPHGTPSARELRRRAERAELRLASLLNNGPTHSRPVWEQEVRAANAETSDFWRRWADTVFR